MTQKTLSLLWWSSYHLKWADHVFKVINIGMSRLYLKRAEKSWMHLWLYIFCLWPNADRHGHLYQVSESGAGAPLLRYDLTPTWNIHRYNCIIMRYMYIQKYKYGLCCSFPSMYAPIPPCQVLPPPSKNPSLQWLGRLHSMFKTGCAMCKMVLWKWITVI